MKFDIVTKHTPGPWELATRARITTAKNTADVCLANIQLDEADANARLIAAAPDLLERLEMLHRVFLQRNLSHEDMLEANLAWISIRKAKGEL